MKKTLAWFLCLILVFCVSACGGDDTISSVQNKKAYKVLEPEKILTVANVEDIVNYTPILTKTKSGKKVTALYCSDPVGQGDVVQIDLYQPGIRVKSEDVQNLFDTEKQMRPSAEDIAELGDQAFIAYPAIHVMRSGYYVKITAGSGGGEEQRELLINAAKTALTNLDELLK